MNMNLRNFKVKDIIRGSDVPYGTVHSMKDGALTLVKKSGNEIKTMGIETSVHNGAISDVLSMGNYTTVESDSTGYNNYRDTLEGKF